MTAALPEEQQTEYKRQHPGRAVRLARRGGTAVAWLAGDDAGYISGAVIPVDGGLGMGH